MNKDSRPAVLVLGCGSIGRRHIANLKSIGETPLAYDPDASRRGWIERNLGVETIATLAAARKRPLKAAWICSPPHLHAALAAPLLRRRIPCFIEKPVAHERRDALRIRRAARGVPAAVGYMLRHHPGLKELKRLINSRRLGRLLFLRVEVGQYLPDWRPWQDYRKSYTANRAMGGGILLDASHELDLARWLAGDVASVFCVARTLSTLKLDVEDTAALTLNFKSGALGEVHVDMIQRAPRRNLEVAFEKGTLLWDMPSAELKTYTAATKRWTSERFKIDVNSLYIEETRAFLKSLASRRKNGLVTIDDGARTLAVVAAARRSARTGRMERVA